MPSSEPVQVQAPTCTPERFAELEATVERGLEAYIQTGQALAEIRDTRAYLLAGYTSFNTYLEGRWSWSRRTAFNLLKAAAVAEDRALVQPQRKVIQGGSNGTNDTCLSRRAPGRGRVHHSQSERVVLLVGCPHLQHRFGISGLATDHARRDCQRVAAVWSTTKSLQLASVW